MAKAPSPAQEEARKREQRTNRLYFDVLGIDGGAKVLEDLERHFAPHSMVKRGPDGSVDPNATLVANGAYEVISYIKQRINFGAENK